ncbi:MAG: hypothetical protein AB7L09_02575 [Nitrospira sp.]
MNERLIHYAVLTPKGPRRKHPFGGPQREVEVSFDRLGEDGWISIRQHGKEVDLGPDEVRRLLRLLVNRYPLDAMSGVAGDDSER